MPLSIRRSDDGSFRGAGEGHVNTKRTAVEERSRRRLKPGQIIAFAVGVLIVVYIFAFTIPRFANYSDVWAALKTLTPIESWSLIAATVFNLYTYWLANQAGLIGMSLKQSAVMTQTSTT